MADDQVNVRPKTPFKDIQNELNVVPQLKTTGALAKYLKRHLEVESWIAYSRAHALKQLRSKADAAHPCLLVVFNMAEIQARAETVQLTPAEALQALDGAFTHYGARVETFAGTQDQKVTKACYFKKFRDSETWAFTPSQNRLIEMAGGAAPPEFAPVPITSADLLFIKDGSVGDCAKLHFFVKR
ncbi:hypothetical protein KFL_000030095 [Klebsormidium nitens]|uniref:Uncharacterized protein n=1 Tax=Klebsormidium nitens TaxID=105231 RepID=A0A1Y1HH23_KLENI|nr:hypothetical protein KFL_000030095 [Klebsormidium nitens]|eukprot:GAQ77730.1 hypothetical protein KFL_000030095 [Klebsormidium nitens]